MGNLPFLGKAGQGHGCLSTRLINPGGLSVREPGRGCPSAPPPHDLIESFEIRSCPPVREILRRLESRDLIRYGCGNELVDTRAVLPAQPPL